MWEGFGCSLAWWANINLPENLKDKLMNLFFTELELNIVRYNLGGGNDKLKSQNFRPGADMPCILNKSKDGKVSLNDFNILNDLRQIDILNKSIELGVTKVELFSNSPPWWMTKSGFSNGSTKSFDCNLKMSELENFGDFIIISYDLMKKNYPVVSIDPFNEPSNPFWKTNVNQEGFLQQNIYYPYLSKNMDNNFILVFTFNLEIYFIIYLIKYG